MSAHEAGTIEALERDGALLVRLEPKQRPRQAVVVLDEHGKPKAYLNECRHLPVPLDGGSGDVLDYTKRYLLCGTHGALYELGSGVCIQGPCVGERLVALRLSQRGNVLIVHDTPDEFG